MAEPLTAAELADVREALDMPAVQFDDAMLTLNRLVPRLLATVEAYRNILSEVAVSRPSPIPHPRDGTPCTLVPESVAQEAARLLRWE